MNFLKASGRFVLNCGEQLELVKLARVSYWFVITLPTELTQKYILLLFHVCSNEIVESYKPPQRTETNKWITQIIDQQERPKTIRKTGKIRNWTIRNDRKIGRIISH